MVSTCIRADVKKCIMNGEIIEDYPDDFPHPSCLIFGHMVNNRIIHVVVSKDLEEMVNSAKKLLQEISVIDYAKIA